ncbi:MAG: sigma-70 family RNA polymerase sigma factor [Saprospiraceae bacterium]|nr:sigma-70 family RNA polymerase sigma factor [Saprospiraceae bacterium]
MKKIMILDNNIQQIIEGCIKKQPKAQRLLVDQFGNLLYAICIRYVGDREKAKDAIQMSFLRILNNIHMHDPQKGKLTSWMTKVTINVCLSELRKKKLDMVSIDNEIIQIPEKNETIIEKLTTDEILSVVEKLPDAYREIFNLAVIDGFSHKQIGEMLEIEEASSRSRLSRAKSMLRDQLSKIKKRESWVNLA